MLDRTDLCPLPLCSGLSSVSVPKMIQCPTCFEYFEVSEIAPEDHGSRMDYDCEVCCRPLILVVEADGSLYSEGLDE